MTGDGPTWPRRRRRHRRGALGLLSVLLVASVIAVGSGAPVSAATFSCTNPVSVEGDSGGNSLTFVMSVSGVLDGPISGIYMTRGAGEGQPPGKPPATATPGIDYRSTSGSFNLGFSGDMEFIDVSVYGDTTVEPDEFFYLDIRSTDFVVYQTYRVGTIVNDDTGVSSALTISDATVTEGDIGTTIANFEVTLSPPAASTVTIDYSTCGVGCNSGASATGNEDYAVNVGKLTFSVGETSRAIPVTVFGDSEIEPDETFYVGIGNAVGVAVVDGSGLGTILDDDAATAPTSSVVSLDPARLLDTRPTGETVDNRFEKVGKLSAGGMVELDVLGRGGVPSSGVGAVVLNVTMIRPDGNGFVTVYPCGTRPLASSMNAPAGLGVVANEVIAKLSGTGTVCLFSSTPTNLAADITGYIPTASGVVSLDPARLLDTRPTGETVDNRFEKVGKLSAGGMVELDVLGRGGVPSSGVGAVVLNVTMIRPDGNGFVTVYPCGTRPLASSMNAPAGLGVVANEVIAKLSGTGTVCLFSSTPTNLAADITGYIPTASGVVSLDPARLLDTRPTGETVDNRFEKVGKLSAGGMVELDVLGRGGVPSSGVGAVVLNVTMIRPDGNGFVTVYPCGTRPLASSMNAPAGLGVVANEVIAKLSGTGTVCLFSSTPTNLAADITGYIVD